MYRVLDRLFSFLTLNSSTKSFLKTKCLSADYVPNGDNHSTDFWRQAVAKHRNIDYPHNHLHLCPHCHHHTSAITLAFDLASTQLSRRSRRTFVTTILLRSSSAFTQRHYYRHVSGLSLIRQQQGSFK